ncbi:hypothetical protein HYC85_028488 [Camellia sinensis]|uniref:non-specific serine/threonine protein kinase n=1 Tax=Camellia sinensis TaxID=4442 RepID=A0A7J7FW24_CAMSI|nr:hypothetical protein HYC85_028488 [Camellia sinensis]
MLLQTILIMTTSSEKVDLAVFIGVSYGMDLKIEPFYMEEEVLNLDDSTQIAVKRLKVWSNKAEMEFAVEVEILARVRHKNLLSLRGYCAEGQERLIVYDYMPNLSLLSHLHGQHSAECLLDWNRRMNIAIGSAEGIA